MTTPSGPTGVQLTSFSSVRGKPSPKQALAGAENDREDHEPVLVDEVVLAQGPDQVAAAGDEDVSRHLLLELRDLAGDVAADHRRVLPRGIGVGERGRDDVLGHAVHLLAEVVGAHRRPRLGEALVGDPAEQLRVGRHQLVVLELVAVLAAVELEHPAAFARRVDDAIG